MNEEIKKIQSIKFIEHNIFKKDSTLTFFDKEIKEGEIPKIFFLVGDNGSGKTSALKSLYDTFANIRYGDYAFYDNGSNLEKYNFSEMGLSILSNESIQEVNVKVKKRDDGNTGLKKSGYSDKINILYDKVQSSFDSKKIKSITTIKEDEEYDDGQYKEINLSEEIPQLLININNTDNQYYRYHSSDDNFDENKDLELNRFLNAFNIFYDGEKKYEKIETGDDEIEILFEEKASKKLVNMNTFSTGEKQIIYRVGHLLKDLNTLDNGIILIDEPETSLHPKWQKKYVDFLLNTFEGLDIQIIIATHSPYILQGMKEGESVAIKIDRTKGGEIGEIVGNYPNSLKNPSINLINYLAYGIVDELLHIELFTALEVRFGSYKSLETNKLKIEQGFDDRSFKATTRVKGKHEIDEIVEESLPIYIRNSIHHADEIARKYSEKDLEKSINIMLKLLK